MQFVARYLVRRILIFYAAPKLLGQQFRLMNYVPRAVSSLCNPKPNLHAS